MTMIMVTTDFVTGHELETLGVVRGSTIQAKNIGRDIGAALKTIIGGELRGYSQMIEQARDIATQRMEQDAAAMGAEAIINLRYTTSAVMQGAAEILVYGTAVRFTN